MNINQLTELAYKLQNEGKIDQAEYIYKNILNFMPENATVYYNLATILHTKGKIDEAITYYKKALQFDSTLMHAYFNMGFIFYHRWLFDEAMDFFQKALELDPKSAEAFNYLGAIYEKKGMDEEAATCYKNAIQNNPRFADAYKRLIGFYMNNTQFEEVIKINRQILINFPELSEEINININELRQITVQREQDAHFYYKTRNLYMESLRDKKRQEEIESDESLLPIIFIHKNNSFYLQYTLCCARLHNPFARIILLGDRTNERYKDFGIEHFYFSDFSKGEEIELFDRVFQYIAAPGASGEWLVRFWFQRWFYMYNFAKSSGINKFWTFDSDNLILTDLRYHISKFIDYDCTEQCNGACMNGYISSLKLVKKYLDKINTLFKDKDYLESLKTKFVNQPNIAFTEMAAYKKYKKTSKIKTIRLNSIINKETFDDAIAQQHDMEISGDRKKLYFKDGNIYVRHLPSQSFVKMLGINMSWQPYDLIRKIYNYAVESFSGNIINQRPS